MAFDGSNNLIVAGQFSGVLNLGNGNLSSAGGNDAFLGKYSSSGAVLWSKRFGGSGSDGFNGVATNSGGSIFTTGSFWNTVNFGGGPLSSAGYSDIVLARYTSSGSHTWSSAYGGTSSDGGSDVAVDAGGNVYLAAWFAGAVDFGGPAFSSYQLDGAVAREKAPAGCPRPPGAGREPCTRGA